jgi:hypothetical protein
MSQTLEDLTDPHGPLYLLVAEVRAGNQLTVESNRLALSNQRRLSFAQVGLLLCLCGIGLSAWYVDETVVKLKELQELQDQQAEVTMSFVNLIQETEAKVEATQKLINSAPKVISDNKGGLVVVATIADSTSIEVVDVPKAPRGPVKRTTAGAARAANGWDEVQDMIDNTARAKSISAGKPQLEQQLLEIPLQVKKAQMR